MYSMNQSFTQIPKIVIGYNAWTKINGYVDLCQGEVSALGSAVVIGDTIHIEDMFIFDQVVTGSSTELSSQDIAKFLNEYISAGKDPSTLKFWWHSHANMDVFWSGTDNSTINRFSSDWLVSMVSNKRGQFKVRFDVFHPIRMCLDDMNVGIGYDASRNADIQQEIAQKVRPQFQFVKDIKDFLRIDGPDSPYPGNDFGRKPPATHIKDNNIETVYKVPVIPVNAGGRLENGGRP